MLKNLLLLSAFSTFAVIVIIGLNIFHNYTLSSLPQSTQTHVLPIPSSFDKKALNELKKRAPVNVVIEGKSGIVSDDSKSTTLSPSPSVSPSPILPVEKISTVSATPTTIPFIPGQ